MTAVKLRSELIHKKRHCVQSVDRSHTDESIRPPNCFLNPGERLKKDIVVSNLSFRYPNSVHLVLKDLSFSLTSGTLYLLRGPNGIGKSTLMDLLAGVRQPTTGLIQVPFDRVEHLPQDYIRSLFPWKSVAWNICLPLILSQELISRKRSIWSRSCAREMLDSTATQILNRIGLELPLREPTHHLSGGQKHLVAIARAIAANPDMLLFDEPDAGLDASNAILVWRAISRFVETKPTSLIVCCTHTQHPLAVPYSTITLESVGRLSFNPSEL